MKPLSHPFDDVHCARIPASALGVLAALRCQTGLEVAFLRQHAYLRWQAGGEGVIRALFPLAECEFFVYHGEHWHRKDCVLPELDFPQRLEYRPLYQVLFPASVQPISVAPVEVLPRPVILIEDHVPRPTSGSRCALADFAAWAQHVPGCALETLRGVVDGHWIFVLGNKVPWIAGEHTSSERFWGHRVLTPIGFRPSPMLAEAELREAAGIRDEELLILRHDGWEIISGELFSPLSHAALRLCGGPT